jgi:RNA polymerase sigma-70 factor (ECF subfamily)
MTPRTDDTVAQLFEAHATALLFYARQWLDEAAAEDAVQRVFVRLIAGGRRPADARTWLYRCVRNEAISGSRSDHRRRRRERAVASNAGRWFVASPEDRIDAVAAEAALRSLSPVRREIVTLRLWSGLTLAQVAEVMGLAVSTVHGHFRSALTEMRQQMEPPCPTNPKH